MICTLLCCSTRHEQPEIVALAILSNFHIVTMVTAELSQEQTRDLTTTVYSVLSTVSSEPAANIT